MLETVTVADQLKQEHEDFISEIGLLNRAASEIPSSSIEERKHLVGQCLVFLRQKLTPHANAEEETIYLQFENLTNDKNSIALLVEDHKEIAKLMDRLEETDSSEVDQLQRLLYGLATLIATHFQKEERFILPALDQEDVALLEQFEAASQYRTPDSD